MHQFSVGCGTDWCHLLFVRKPTPTRGSKSSSDQTPAWTTRKYHPTYRLEVTISSKIWHTRRRVRAVPINFLSNLFPVGVVQPFQPDLYSFWPDLIAGIRIPVISKLFLARSGFFNNRISVINCFLLFSRQISPQCLLGVICLVPKVWGLEVQAL